jgi:peptidyl-prolyl cis-trans isomerase SurA
MRQMNKIVFVLGVFLVGLMASVVAAPIDGIAAVVNDDVVTQHEVQAGIAQLKQELAHANTTMPTDAAIRKKVLQHLINVKLQLQVAKRSGISISSEEVDNAIQGIAKNNQITVEVMREQLAAQGVNYTDYRKKIQEQMLLSKTQQQALMGEVKVSPEELKHFMKTFQPAPLPKAAVKYQVASVRIPLDDAASAEDVAKVKQEAQVLFTKFQKASQFGDERHPSEDLGWRDLNELPSDYAKLVVSLKPGQVSQPLRTGNGFHIIKLVATHSEQKNNPSLSYTESHVRHILIKTGPLTNDADMQARLQEISQQLKGGVDFATLARRYSQDPGSASKGGDLGWVTPDLLVPSFAQTMDALNLNQISKPVKTSYGWHLIQLLGRRTVDNSKNQVQSQAQAALYKKKFEVALNKWLQQLRVQAYVREVERA